MKIEFYGFNTKSRFRKWYTDFTGVILFGRRFLGFSIYNRQVVIQLKPEIISKPSTGIWLAIFFYDIHIELKNPWKGTKYEEK